MGKKNWIEFDNYENIDQEQPKEENLKKKSKLNMKFYLFILTKTFKK